MREFAAAAEGLGRRLVMDDKSLASLQSCFARDIDGTGIDAADLLDRLGQTGSLKAALGAGPEVLAAFYARAVDLIKIGQTERAMSRFYVLCALDGRKPDHWLGYGICLRSRGQAGLALTAFDMAAGIAPDALAPQLYRLELFMRECRWEEAHQALKRFDEIARQSPEPVLQRAAEPFRTALAMRGP
jgi:tetratricopeptide (TPR) repeat protein